jgi:glycosyltransferase involved in cell wall biosynthesis
MKLCYWGTYDSHYPRNKILISGLRKNGVEVVECNAKIWQDTPEKMAAASSSWTNLGVLRRWLAAYTKLIKSFSNINDIEFIMVGYSGHFDVFLAKILSKIRRVPLVFDAFLSLYDSLVFDRKVVKKGSPKAKFLYYIDKYSCKLADLVLLDTNQHIDYFVSEFGLSKEKFYPLFIGADDSVFFLRGNQPENNKFTVIHFGKYIPLHGMEYIIQAAGQLNGENIHFQLIGAGDGYRSSVALAEKLKLANVEFIQFLDQNALTEYIENADICLGIFGDTDKAKRVVPNKVYEAMAMRKPVITGDSSAAREILKHGEDCLLCEMANPHAIAEAILRLKTDERLRTKIAAGAYKTYKTYFSPSALGKQLNLALLESKIPSRFQRTESKINQSM